VVCFLIKDTLQIPLISQQLLLAIAVVVEVVEYLDIVDIHPTLGTTREVVTITATSQREDKVVGLGSEIFVSKRNCDSVHVGTDVLLS